MTRSHVIAYIWGIASSSQTNKSETNWPAERFNWQVVGGRRCECKGYPLKDWKSDSMPSQEFYFQFEGVYTHTHTPSTAEQAQVGRNLLQHWRHINNLLIPSAQSLVLYRHFMEISTFQRHVICLEPTPHPKVGTCGRGYRLSQFTFPSFDFPGNFFFCPPPPPPKNLFFFFFFFFLFFFYFFLLLVFFFIKRC